MTALLIFEAIDTAIALVWAFVWWLLGLAAVGTVLVLAVWCTLAAAWRAIRKRLARPSWAHSRRAARRFARASRPSEHRRPHDYQEAA